MFVYIYYKYQYGLFIRATVTAQFYRVNNTVWPLYKYVNNII